MAPNRILFCGAAALALAACDGIPDFDLRNLGNGFDTSAAVANLPDRPAPDDRGVISYPNYQVVVARQGDTITTIANRVGLDAAELARYNGMDLNVPLRSEEVIALPRRVAEPAGGRIETFDITDVATTALDRVDSQAPTVTTLPSATPQAAPAPQAQSTAPAEPLQHKIAAGETIFSISRLYGVPVQNLAEWNGLGSDLTIREGAFLLIPQSNARPPAAVETLTEVITTPGTGSETPLPPSASQPLPEDDTTAEANAPDAPEAPDLGTQTTTETARLLRPVEGSVIRAYAPGRNEGIDIGVPAGTSVKAADGGTVAAVTTDTNGVAIVVIKHPDNLLTVYTNLEELTVSKNVTVARGQTIGSVSAGDPSFLHFEVRRGLQSVDPADFLP